jgi:hypothetical protein
MLITGIDWQYRRWFVFAAGFMLAAGSMLAAGTVRADNFGTVAYDAEHDALVVSMIYDGTNPNHTFSLQWGECKQLQPGDVPEIDAEVIDSQYEDVAQNPYTVTVSFPLADLRCQRPANVTLRTAPRFYRTLYVPAARNAPATR